MNEISVVTGVDMLRHQITAERESAPVLSIRCCSTYLMYLD